MSTDRCSIQFRLGKAKVSLFTDDNVCRLLVFKILGNLHLLLMYVGPYVPKSSDVGVPDTD